MENVSVISNPPYNLKWQYPPFAQLEDRFKNCTLPPESNANYAFILTALEQATEKAILILPNGILTTTQKEEEQIKKYLIKNNFIEAIIVCANKMFESTNIHTCILMLNKNKQNDEVMMIDLRDKAERKARSQKGQFGGNSHTKRIYNKIFNTYTDEIINKTKEVINSKEDIDGFSKKVTLEEIEKKDFKLNPDAYLEKIVQEKTRDYKEILADINRVIENRNACKLTINETLAKKIGLYEIYELSKKNEENTKILNEYDFLEGKINKSNFIQVSKNKNEIKFENGSKECISSIFMLLFQQWKTMVYFLNEEENRYLAELRDKLLPDLISGKIDLSGEVDNGI